MPSKASLDLSLQSSLVSDLEITYPVCSALKGSHPENTSSFRLKLFLPSQELVPKDLRVEKQLPKGRLFKDLTANYSLIVGLSSKDF